MWLERTIFTDYESLEALNILVRMVNTMTKPTEAPEGLVSNQHPDQYMWILRRLGQEGKQEYQHFEIVHLGCRGLSQKSTLQPSLAYILSFAAF